jgi:hypothetical protein
MFQPPEKYNIKITELGNDEEAFNLVRDCFV